MDQTPEPPQTKRKKSAAGVTSGDLHFHGRCRVCTHEQRAQIETCMAAGQGIERIGKRFNVGKFSVWRHWQNHVSDALKVARQAHALAPGIDASQLVRDESAGLLQQLQTIRASLYQAYDKALLRGDDASQVRLSAQLHTNLAMVGKVTGELLTSIKKVEHEHVLLSPGYVQLRTKILTALRPYPDALQAVLQVFKQTDTEELKPGSPLIDITPGGAAA